MSSVVISGDTSGAITLSAPAVSGTNTATLPAATGTVMVSGNMPAFSVYQSSSQTGIASGVSTKIQFQTKEYDTNNNFDNATNYRFTPTVAGYYQVNACIAWTSAYTSGIIYIYKNGTDYKGGGQPQGTVYRSAVSALVYCNGSTDYIEIYGTQASGGTGSTAAAINYTYFQAALVRAA